jgi:hypothetical protein
MNEMSEMIPSSGTPLVPLNVKNAVGTLAAPTVPVGFETANFGPDTPGFQKMIFQVDEPATQDRADHVAEPFGIRYWHAKKVELANERTGELEAAIRLTFLDAAGRTLSFVSWGVVDSFDRLRQIHGDGPYDPPLRVLVASLTTKTKRTMVRLRPAEEQ